MNRNALRPMYSNLTAQERFRLSVQAGAGGDHQEAMHLVRSCPTVEGTVLDPSFTTPTMASHRLAKAFAQAAGPYLGWLNAVGVLEDLLTGDRGRAALPHEALFPVAMVLDRAAEVAARDLRALQDAFEEVCRTRTGLPPEVLLAFWVPDVALALQAADAWTQGLEADPVTKEGFAAWLDHAWTLSPEGN
jgi:hypothetical protein